MSTILLKMIRIGSGEANFVHTHSTWNLPRAPNILFCVPPKLSMLKREDY